MKENIQKTMFQCQGLQSHSKSDQLFPQAEFPSLFFFFLRIHTILSSRTLTLMVHENVLNLLFIIVDKNIYL